ncbi:hypothetical protein AX774_g8054 [Zancudomyces culisetae]|uniref:Uncharacterized protein n=1 Tax=Zancudomyces culisetae TaxID=1213189 RepID=A0A1R1PC72_ZANCU|nr:hypothetical protein AX774_g8054 [Zancudomyces culisetae]|eukprot:OMH78553.1 hypothetical protein AX774_g8054 [Zancudomyces culisetae]
MRRLFFDDRSDDIDIQQVVLKKKQHSEAVNTALEIIRSSVEESDNNVDLRRAQKPCGHVSITGANIRPEALFE